MKSETTTESAKSIGIAEPEHKSKSNSEELIQYHKVENSPFTIAKYEGEWFVMMGKYKLTQGIKTKQEALKQATETSWGRIMQVIHIMIEDNNETNKTKNN